MAILSSLWLIGLPVAYYYAFTLHQGVAGLWKVMPYIYLVFNALLLVG